MKRFILKNKLGKGVIIGTILLIIAAILLIKINSRPNEKLIKNDIISSDFCVDNSLEIDNYEITLSQKSGKKCYYNIHTTLNNSYESVDTDFELVYSKYDQGWNLIAIQNKNNEWTLTGHIPEDKLCPMIEEASSKIHVATHEAGNNMEAYTESFEIISYEEDIDKQTIIVNYKSIIDGDYGVSNEIFTETFSYVEGNLISNNVVLEDYSFDINTDAFINKKVSSGYYSSLKVKKIVKDNSGVYVIFDYHGKTYTRKGSLEYNSNPYYIFKITKESELEIDPCFARWWK
ncbi:MAG: hypothetical protein E7Z86_10135 [Methanosphaera stadtmanae]|nr:hypothetical protein [Methanosphaera stadtmanae]